MSPGIFLWVALGGAAGACLRYATSQLVVTSSGFPLATLLVNVIGSFAIGLVYVLIMEKGIIASYWRPLILAGFLGGFTTFSALSLEAITLIEAGRWQMALAYVLLSVALCLLGAAGGMLLVRSLA